MMKQAMTLVAILAALTMWASAYAAEEPLDASETAVTPVVIPAKSVDNHRAFIFTLDTEHKNLRVLWRSGEIVDGAFVENELKRFTLDDSTEEGGAQNWTALLAGVDIVLPQNMPTQAEGGPIVVIPAGTTVRIKGSTIYKALIQAMRDAGAF
jgi:hypothetical protein